jgi:hypothetical protein
VSRSRTRDSRRVGGVGIGHLGCRRPVAIYDDEDGFSAERMATEFGVDLAVARRALEQMRGFTVPPLPSLVIYRTDGVLTLADVACGCLTGSPVSTSG